MPPIIDQTRPDQTRPDQTATHALISVIVPAYNVEKYLARCLDSILTQTYTNIEVILIDDGSTDETGRICDDYAGKDERVKVIHQVNQGLAEVRNVGLREAKGEWIQFVDSDDWIEPNTLETCYRYAQEYNADIVSFQYIQETDSGKSYSAVKEHKPPEVMTSEKALSVIFIPQFIDVAAWNKLVRKECYHGVVYPKGKLYEDTYTTYKVIANAERVLYITNEFYHYLRRKDSIMGYRFDERNYDLADAAQKSYDESLKLGASDDDGSLSTGLWFFKVVVADYMIKAGKINYEYVSKVQHEIKYSVVMKCPYMPLVRKIQVILFRFSFRLYKSIFMKAKRI